MLQEAPWFFPNLDNHYLRTIVNRKHGKVLVIRAKAPKTLLHTKAMKFLRTVN